MATPSLVFGDKVQFYTSDAAVKWHNTSTSRLPMRVKRLTGSSSWMSQKVRSGFTLATEGIIWCKLWR